MNCDLVVLYLSYHRLEKIIYQLGKQLKKIKKLLKTEIPKLGMISNSCQFVHCCRQCVQKNSLNYSPFSSLQLQKKYNGKDK